MSSEGCSSQRQDLVRHQFSRNCAKANGRKKPEEKKEKSSALCRNRRIFSISVAFLIFTLQLHFRETFPFSLFRKARKLFNQHSRQGASFSEMSSIAS